eukprot:TRINITY_DN4918_c0_g1_i2.p1 TRINITY_DN4918_c0_g1~~TRINITY_DN4918_c0_g1_i2.p1  ORF type:complete len:371 (-),score=93.02 TRINITY_DN4918_c0_g1_i2:28-1140(-)
MSESVCEYTLYAGDEISGLDVTKYDGQDVVIASTKKGILLVWKIDELKRHEKDRRVSELGKRSEDGKKIKQPDLLDQTDDDHCREWEDLERNVEVTKGQVPHLRISINSPVDLFQVTCIEDVVAFTCNKTYTVDLFDLKTRKTTFRMLGATGEITNMAVCKDAPHLLASCERGGNARIWNVQTGLRVWTLQGNHHNFFGISMAQVSGVVFAFVGGINNTVKVFDITKGQFLYELSAGGGVVCGIAWNAANMSLYAVVHQTEKTRQAAARRLHRGGSIDSDDDDFNPEDDMDGDEDEETGQFQFMPGETPEIRMKRGEFPKKWTLPADDKSYLIRYQFMPNPRPNFVDFFQPKSENKELAGKEEAASKMEE